MTIDNGYADEGKGTMNNASSTLYNVYPILRRRLSGTSFPYTPTNPNSIDPSIAQDEYKESNALPRWLTN